MAKRLNRQAEDIKQLRVLIDIHANVLSALIKSAEDGGVNLFAAGVSPIKTKAYTDHLRDVFAQNKEAAIGGNIDANA